MTDKKRKKKKNWKKVIHMIILEFEKFKTITTTHESYFLFFLGRAEKHAIIRYFRKSYFTFLLSFLGLTRDESKEILNNLIKSGYIIPLRKFGFTIDIAKARYLVNLVNEAFFETIKARYSKDQLLSLLDLKEFLEGEQNE